MKTYYLLIFVFFLSCTDTKTTEQSSSTTPSKVTEATSTKIPTNKAPAIPQKEDPIMVEEPQEESENKKSYVYGREYYDIDLKQSLENKSLEEIRLLKNGLYARQGYLFNKAELRGYFDTFEWYPDLAYDRWRFEGNNIAKPIEFNEAEQAFLAKATAKEKALLKENFYRKDNQQKVNVKNIINKFQFKDLEQSFVDKIGENGFAIVPNKNIQLFHVYEQNDYQQIPNFVTTDIFLQLYHMYFSFLLRDLEENIFYGKVGDVSYKLYHKAYKDYENATDEQSRESAKFSAIFFGVASRLTGVGKKQILEELGQDISGEINKEYAKVQAAEDDNSEFFNQPFFPYSLFKPRGHYTRSDTLTDYFKVMMWLQKGEMCLYNDQSLHNAIYMANLLTKNDAIYQDFLSVFDPIKFIIGEPDNLSIVDVIHALPSSGEVDLEILKTQLKGLYKNKIGPKGDNQITCPDKINLMPQRFVLDNEILQDLADTKTKPQTKRAYPKGIDVFGVLGVNKAEDLLYNFHKEAENWDQFDGEYKRLKNKLNEYDGWNNCVYNKWIECLKTMQTDKQNNVPYFMKTDGWAKKDLNTALASWAELKHDAILYAEQPMAAECGDGGPPPPVTVGYVEPNIPFWKSMLELINLTENLLKKNDLFVPNIANKSQEIREIATFLLQISEKEMRGEKLTTQEYNAIEIIGSTIEYATLALIGKSFGSDWDDIKGPDREVSVIADIYTANARNNPNHGILHVGVGPVNDIYVVVEIEGYLYLTKGAVFSYHEFAEPMGSRLTDEEWQERLKKGKIPPVPEWMKDLIYDKKKPEPNEKIFYSSGC